MKLRLLHWFFEKGVDVRIFANIRIDGISDGAEHDDTGILGDVVVFNGPGQLYSVHSRHLHVDNGERVWVFIRNRLAQELKRFFPAGR